MQKMERKYNTDNIHYRNKFYYRALFYIVNNVVDIRLQLNLINNFINCKTSKTVLLCQRKKISI